MGTRASALWALILAGCTARIGDPPGVGSDPSQPSHPQPPQQPNAPIDPMDPIDPCATPAVLEAPSLRRLSHSEWNNTMRALVEDPNLAPRDLVEDNRAHGFENNAGVLVPSAVLIEEYQSAAVELTEALVSRFLAGRALSGVSSCSPESRTQAEECAARVISAFGRRAFRRPLTTEEVSDFASFFSEQYSISNFSVALQLVLQVILQSPETLYRELEGGDYALASRLAYFLTGAPPDETLLSAAARGPVDVEVEARRLLADPKARSSRIDFHRQWLDLDRLERVNKDPGAHPSFNEQLRRAMREETERFVASAPTMNALFTSRETEVNAPLASLYGLSEVTGWTAVSLPSTERAGFLTQAGFLASHAHPVEPSPVLRGVFVLERLLCDPIPPPEGVDITPPRNDPAQAPTTNRQRYAAHLNQPTCANCHVKIDGIGFAFENYDSLGKWRELDNGLAVDASGRLVNTDSDGAFNGAIELAARLAASKQVERCVTTQWYRFALGRNETDDDACAIHTIESSFATSGQNFDELLVSIATSEAFATSRAAE